MGGVGWGRSRETAYASRAATAMSVIVTSSRLGGYLWRRLASRQVGRGTESIAKENQGADEKLLGRVLFSGDERSVPAGPMSHSEPDCRKELGPYLDRISISVRNSDEQ